MRVLPIVLSLLLIAGCGTGNPPPTTKERAEQKQLRQLMAAAATGNMKTAAALLEEDPSLVQLRDSSRNTVLHFAVSTMVPPKDEMVAFLLDRGADVNAAGSLGETALGMAALKGYAHAAAILLARGADPNHHNIHGATPLHHALFSGKEETAMLLVDHGAEPDFFDAAALGRVEWLKTWLERDRGLLNQTDTELRFKRSSAGFRQGQNWTALHWAARYGRLEAVKFLLESGADPLAEDRTNWRPSSVAAEWKQAKLRALLDEAEKRAEQRVSAK